MVSINTYICLFTDVGQVALDVALHELIKIGIGFPEAVDYLHKMLVDYKMEKVAKKTDLDSKQVDAGKAVNDLKVNLEANDDLVALYGLTRKLIIFKTELSAKKEDIKNQQQVVTNVRKVIAGTADLEDKLRESQEINSSVKHCLTEANREIQELQQKLRESDTKLRENDTKLRESDANLCDAQQDVERYKLCYVETKKICESLLENNRRRDDPQGFREDFRQQFIRRGRH